eukprot:jgi/Undpi1/1659/HiC_scaffold_11.g05049.m1
MLYADDAAIVSRSSEGLERMMTVIVTACSSFGLTFSEARTEIMCLQTKGGGKVSFTINVQPARPKKFKRLATRETLHGSRPNVRQRDLDGRVVLTPSDVSDKAENFTAAGTADIVLNEYIPLWGCPVTPLSDNGQQFTSKLATIVYDRVGIRKVNTSAYHPCTNGGDERVNHELAQMPSMVSNEKQTDWDVLLPHVPAAYNTSVNVATGLAPNEIHIGRLPRLPPSVFEPENIGGHQSLDRDHLVSINLATDRQQRGTVTVGLAKCQEQQGEQEEGGEEAEIQNWSSTHSVTTRAYLQPDSVEKVEDIVSKAHSEGKRIRVVGNALSPNGIGLSEGAMISLGQCDRVLRVDKRAKTVTVEAGARIQQVVDAVAPYNLTLQNYASINEQQLGGFFQVGAHGTGATIPPVDEQVVAMKLVTPNLGTIELSNNQNPWLFRMAKVGLGALGVVTEVTIQCVERHQLLESTSVMTRAEVKENHESLLQNNKHVRYMWIPYTDAVVVVRCNPLDLNDQLLRRKTQPPTNLVTCQPRGDDNVDQKAPDDARHRLQPLKTLLLEKIGSNLSVTALKDVDSLDFAGLRDMLLAQGPLDVAWVKKVNAAEAEFWRRSQGKRVDFSDRILGFECGGQQWVNEVSFPVGTLEKPNGKDLDYMTELMSLIETEGVPAPAPIEQRWTASSSSRMSPAHDKKSPETLFSWVGVIMYLPADDMDARNRVADAFLSYRDLCKASLWDRYDCVVHWAKLEKPRSEKEAKDTRARLQRRFPMAGFNSLRTLLDPKNIMANDHIDACFGQTENRK